MAEAIRLAELGLWSTSPNPRVGCVLVRQGQVVGAGWHRQAGAPHAEVLALAAAGAAAEQATAYVTLEPCSHHGRTPPCAEALIAARVGRVVVAMTDPNPLVAGRGIQRLQQAGIRVEVGLLTAAAEALNPGFISRMVRQRPWVRFKVAATLDGRTALNNGASQWITGPEARVDGHRWRARACAILTGIGTVRDDDPQLTVRAVNTPRQPLRVLVDSRLELPLTARLLDGGPLLIAAAADNDAPFQARATALRARGAEIIVLPNAAGKVDLAALMCQLAERGINELHVEAGHKLNGSLLHAGLVDEMLLYLAPCLVGDAARGLAALPALTSLSGRLPLQLTDVRQIGQDLRLLARVGVPVATD